MENKDDTQKIEDGKVHKGKGHNPSALEMIGLARAMQEAQAKEDALPSIYKPGEAVIEILTD